ncbi:MAG: KTSC domain-containing protein [Malacoplasma sp.]|nr:KTSC domain-containing protein [Malacoplasma sp.]
MSNYGIEMFPVSSSNVDSVGYDENFQILYVRFLNGSLYIYKGVPLNEYQGLRQASSVGSYLHSNIKNFYPYERIE